MADVRHDCACASTAAPLRAHTEVQGAPAVHGAATPAAQDYRVHLKHLDGSTEKVPYFCLPANELNDVIAPSCYSCFDYPNALADLARAALPMSVLWQMHM